MKGSKIKEIEGSSKGMYIRIADIPKLSEIGGQRLLSLEKRANLYQNSEQIYKLNKKRDCHE
jgi:hypothetical protein